MSPRSSSRRSTGRFALAGALSATLCAALAMPAAAQSVRKQCSEKYQAAKAAGTLNGQAWPQFYSQCAAETKTGASPEPAAAATPAPAPVAAPAPAPANPLKPAVAAPTPKTTAAPPPAPSGPAGPAVFPSGISAAYSSEKPSKARFKTCLDQYKANKATNANGGMRWITKGGGYYSECNARLKG